jgi:hypothetical protein
METLPQQIQGWFLSIMVAVIAYFLKRLLTEQKDTRTDVTELLRQQAIDQTKMIGIIEQITELKKSDDRQQQEHAKLQATMVDAVQRLVRLEERSYVKSVPAKARG